jgi:meiosis induction protein kinase IME2/SME1
VTPHLQANVDLPQIPFSRGQPGRAELDEIFQNMEQQRQQRIHDVSRTSSIPPRNEPPSHSHLPVHEPPNFNVRDSGRVLPPLAGSPHNNRSYHVSPERPRRYDSPTLHTSSASTSQTLLPNLSSYNNGASALVESLRELDLPTADLSTYGHRSLSPGHAPEWKQRPAPVPHPSGDRQGHGDRRSSDLVGLQAMSLAAGGTASQSSFHHSTSGHVSYTQDSLPQPQYQRNYLPPHMSTPTALASGLSPRGSFDSLRDHNSTDSLPRPHEDHDVVMQDAFDDHPVHNRPAMETDTHPYRSQPGQDQPRSQAFANTTSRLTNLAATGKKKKWGLSAVFSSLNDSKAELQVPPPGNIVSSGFSSAALKRTQSGITAAERAVMSQADLASGADPKKVKKEMEKQAKEQEKQLQVARRKAMEDAQKERARAVMAKRSQLVENRSNNKSEIEWTTLSTIDSASMKTSNTSQTSIPMPDGSKSQSAQDLIPKREPYMGASKTAGSRSQPSIRSQLESMSQSHIDRRQMEMSGPDAYRFKARKMDFGDDHTGYRNASVLSVGTIDSE